jgi:very-short-patch-repair endonuclease
MLQGPKETIRRARRLRREMSLPEVLLWQELRRRPGGLKFRKQHPGGPYIGDLFCHAARLVVEVDGEAHDRGDRPRRDAARDAWFAERRFAVMRIPASEVMGNLEGVVQGIVARARRKNPPLKGEGDRPEAGGGVSDSSIHPQTLTPFHHAAHGPPPPLGEDL